MIGELEEPDSASSGTVHAEGRWMYFDLTYFIFSAQDGSFFDKASNTVANEVKREVARCLPASESIIPTTVAYLSDNVGTKMTKKLPRIGRLKTLLSR